MIVGEQKLGAILVGFNSHHKFSASEVEWGILAANQIALALHKSLLINELKKSNEDKDRFFSMLSHDLKGPFSGVEQLVSFLTENQNKLSDIEISELLNTLQETTTNLNVLIDNMLSWSRLNRGLLTLNLGEFALSELIDEVRIILEPQAHEKNIPLTDSTDHTLSLTADREMIKAVLRNLISNAIKFSHPGTEVRLKTKSDKEGISLIVEDNGVGISDENLNLLHSTGNIPSIPGTAQESGTGLGLLIIQEFVKLHKGQLLVQSKPQAGSTFTVQLPQLK